MATVVICGIGSGLGRRVAALAAGDAQAVVGEVAGGRDPLDVVLLAPAGGPDRDGSGMGDVDLAAAADLLDALADREVRSLVALSTAMVYGAWPDNPVPLTEDRLLRPNPGARVAAGRAELERLVAEFGRARPEVPVAVLRPTITTAGEVAAVDWMGRSLWHVATARHGDGDPPAQFLHLDDLAGAIDHARRHRLRGPHNVAPEGWLPPARQVDLVGWGGRIRVPATVAGPVATWRWRAGLTSTPPEVLPYTMHPWVVASDRLRATGWRPRWSNEEAFVVGSRPGRLSSLDARRRQELSLGVGGLLLAAVVAVAVVAWRRRAR